MARVPVFYSFHYDNDVFRVQQVRNMGVVDGNAPVSANDWEQVKRQGDAAVERWIDESMKYRRCVVVLIGSETASRKWVKHEIKRAWELKEGALWDLHPQPQVSTERHVREGCESFRQLEDRQPINGKPCCMLRPFELGLLRRQIWGDMRNLEGWVDSAIQAAQRR